MAGWIVRSFVDDFGNEVFPYQLGYETYIARYNFYKGE